MNSLAGILLVLTPDVLAALGRILTLASRIGDVDRASFFAAISDAIDPSKAEETAAKALGAELDALQLRADVLALQGVFAAQEAQRVGDSIGSL